jgi:paraquat-inducible protein A
MSTHPSLSAAASGFQACHVCGRLAARRAGRMACPRCGSRLHARKPDSIARTWALLIAAYILLIPANLLPVMETGSLFGAQRDTIMSGVIYLWISGSWPLAVLVFFASIVVPLSKLIILSLLAGSVQAGAVWLPYERTRLYRLVEFVGRWSMLDIFVVTVLAALVRLQTLANIRAGPGALAFGAVVVLTMLASMAFDPRLIWDNVKEDHD